MVDKKVKAPSSGEFIEARRNGAEEYFQDTKNRGKILFNAGRLSKEDYYKKIRKVGIETGVISPNEFPGGSSKILEPFLEIGLGTIGYVAGAAQGLRKGAQGLSAVGPLAEINFLGQLAASPFTGQGFDDMALTPAGTIQNLLRGPDKVTQEGSEGNVTPIIETQEEQFAGLKEDAEKRAQLYMELMDEEPDTMGAMSRGLMNAAQLYDEDKAADVGALGMEADAETQKQKDIESQIKGMAVQDVVGAETNRQQLVDQATLAIVSSTD